jgi:catechol 2,3-dioxygenase-like lactoylglutathione lyase family enzyme
MADQSPFSTSIIHHPGLRVEDAEAGKRWLTTMLGFRVEHEFQFAGHDFVWLSPAVPSLQSSNSSAVRWKTSVNFPRISPTC